MRGEEPSLLKKRRRLIHDAVRDGNVCQLRYLLKRRGENVNTQDDQRKTALIIATETKYTSLKIQRIILQLILDAQPDVNLKDREKRSALTHACKTNNVMAVHLILRERVHDLCFDSRDSDGMTSLMHAVRNGNYKIVKILLSPWKRFSLSLVLENKYGENVMDIALLENNRQIIDLLKENGFSAQIPYLTTPTNQRASTASRGTRENKNITCTLRRVKSSIPAFNRKQNKISDSGLSTISTTSTYDQTKQNLHHLFDLYSEQLSPSYKASAKPLPLNDRDDLESLDSLASIQSFRSVRCRDKDENDTMEQFLQNLRLSDQSRQGRARRTGASLVVPNSGRSRKISAPCFPSNPMYKPVLSRREIKSDLITHKEF